MRSPNSPLKGVIGDHALQNYKKDKLRLHSLECDILKSYHKTTISESSYLLLFPLQWEKIEHHLKNSVFSLFTPLESPAIYDGDDINKASIPYRKGGVKAPSFLTGFAFGCSAIFCRLPLK
jgi:hypothetical protein